MPVLSIVDPLAEGAMAPINSYVLLEEIREDGSKANRTFNHVNTIIEAEEAEEVGVEHLIRNVKDVTVGNLSKTINNRAKSLSTLNLQLAAIEDYLGAVIDGRLPVNQQIMASIQDIFNLLPDVHSAEAEEALTVKTNDQLALIYFASLARSTIALNDLISNKIEAFNAIQQPITKNIN